MPAAAIGTFSDYAGAEAAVRALGLGGFDIEQLSVVGNGYHLDEHVAGFYNQGDHIRFWGKRGAFWTGLWSLFFGGMIVVVPVAGPVVMLGYLGSMAAAALEGAVEVGGVSVISAALYDLGIPKDSVVQYETAITTDCVVVIAHDSHQWIAVARFILEAVGAAQVEVHHGLSPPDLTPLPA